MNEIGSGFLNLSGYQQIKEYSEESLSNLTGKPVSVLLKEDEKKEFPNYMAEWCYRQSIPCGHGECQFPDDNGLYVPIRNREKTYGVIIFDCEGWTLSEEEKIYVDTVISQLTLVIERELLSREKENTRIQVERERLKSTLLRSISHDLRTPLTGITGSAGFLLDNLGIMDEATIKSMLKDICSDSEWLSTMVENLLNLTRIQEGRLDINKRRKWWTTLWPLLSGWFPTGWGTIHLRWRRRRTYFWYLWTEDCSSRFWSIFWTMRSAIPGPAPR